MISNDKSPILISVVLPCFNEAGNVRAYYNEFISAVDLIEYQYELLFIDDGSSDSTWHEIKSLPVDKVKIIGIRLLFNCGHAVALEAGLEKSDGAAIIMMDSDLQHPVKYINQMINCWRNGYHIANCIRVTTNKIGFIKKLTSKFFYKFINSISDLSLKDGESDFRLVDRSLLTLVNSYPESPKFYRGIFNKLNQNSIEIEYHAPARASGKSSYTFAKMFSLARLAITSFSDLPLMLILYFGILTTLVSFILIILFGFYKLFINYLFISGAAMLAFVLVFILGLLSVFIGLLSMYLVDVLRLTRARPAFVIGEIYSVVNHTK
jgi:glycosyltransferase involved in cell wall biosynthesis